MFVKVGYSPLYCLLHYVNDIITCVESSGYGYVIAGKCVGILMYADDLLLISATCNGLIRLIEIGEQEMAWLDMQFNARKSCMVRCGPRHNKECADILPNGVPLNRGKTFKYLGILFEVGSKLKVSLAAKRMKFVRAFNNIYGCWCYHFSCGFMSPIEYVLLANLTLRVRDSPTLSC